jgi:hypothetical protein
VSDAAWTTERILTLAPDPASAKAGKDLAAARKWVSFGRDDRTAWGECQGSGAKPYQTQIDLAEPAFKCSCPSRKFPCKHALGLFLLTVAQNAAPTQASPPQWVQEWLASRAQKSAKKAEKQQAAAAGVVAAPDPETQAKRAAERERKVAAGLDELDLWLRDLVRQGLASAQSQPTSYWESRAARLVDAQAPGMARLVRDMATAAAGDGWQSRLLAQIARTHLAVEGFRRADALPAETRETLRAVIGWTTPQDQLLARPGVRDNWHVVGQRVTVEESLRAQRTYLWGEQSARPALLLQFAHGSQPFAQTLLPGTRVVAEIVYFPGAGSLRATLKERDSMSPPAPVSRIPGHQTVAGALAAYAGHLAQNPWTEDYPLALAAVTPQRVDGDRWTVADAAGHRLPLRPRFPQAWQLAALSGGRPLSLFGEWDGRSLLPLSAADADGTDFILFRTGDE